MYIYYYMLYYICHVNINKYSTNNYSFTFLHPDIPMHYPALTLKA